MLTCFFLAAKKQQRTEFVCGYLILRDVSAAFDVPVGQDDVHVVHFGLLPVLFKNPDFQATAEDDGSIACNGNALT